MTVEDLISALARGAVGKFAPYPLNTILGYLIDQVSTQEEKLSSFELKLDEHITSPFRVGRVYLEEARNAPDRNRQREHLNKALEEFIRASQIRLSGYPLLPIKAQFYVGVCYDLLSDDRNALRWYQKSYQSNERIYQSFPRGRIPHKIRIAEPKSGVDKALFGAIDLIFNGVEWLDEGLIHRKRSKELDQSLERLKSIGRETAEFRKSLSALLASRRLPGLPR
jgi:tetratricopeptide (TPR) repeat protein